MGLEVGFFFCVGLVISRGVVCVWGGSFDEGSCMCVWVVLMRADVCVCVGRLEER